MSDTPVHNFINGSQEGEGPKISYVFRISTCLWDYDNWALPSVTWDEACVQDIYTALVMVLGISYNKKTCNKN